MTSYTYLGDRLTAPEYKKAKCNSVNRENGKCIRGKNSNMLCEFNGQKVIILARLLRKEKLTLQP